ncbi:DUF4065 domain-containing protein [Caulobacter vibrioides]|uniref:Antitoxin SocA n=2 Tax=Caulobacter vibrioides TaxID=155892 RepID=SOCA_CAUVN|nr:Panacea domain-containing protein [Caulobacter vibrioides]YP_002519003.1 antitoxin protein SocA [Caulobacter vibrioides NA1000]A0A0H3CCP8.1 RecName: Full=Antitoxin SocA; AltName: Full=Adapter protein SocA [Caulobacter vibrioides NA1000]QBQ57406.1 DUF4065 domain-containing protein [synthetic Caulobacter sp. 'ethensis']AAK25477.1 conserved hypothetical protein [Caulobacter vibrioides CB15]ACL97095.1 antitoxin protein SocA [Caulobacter vibrioides NA1000]ATC30330.1 DUF4065 domain-containing pr
MPPLTQDPQSVDARAVANLLLDKAAALDIPISNLALQKLLYFAHGRFLVDKGRPLVNGFFEAWKFGPVHPVVYRCFSANGPKYIINRAIKKDILSGLHIIVSPPRDQDIHEGIERVLLTMGRMSASQLVAVSHASGGPWDVIANGPGTNLGLGLRICDKVIKDRFRFQKVSVSVPPGLGDTLEEAPPS